MMPKEIIRQIIALLLAVAFVPLDMSAQENDRIPFLYRGHLILQSTINDSVSCNIVYDTGGADMYIVDSVYLLHSNWKPQNFMSAIARGGAGRTKVKVITDPTKVDIGCISDTYKMVPIFKLRDILDCHVDGLWGIKNVTEYPFEINFEHSFLKQHKAGLPDTDGYMKLPIMMEDKKIMVQAKANIGGTEIDGWYLMDTGSAGTIDFIAKTVEKYQLETIPGKRYITDIRQFGVGDKEQEWYVDMLADSIIIGNDTICRRSISYIPEGAGAFSNRNYVGVIGNSIWSKFNIIIDVKNHTLYLRRFKAERGSVPTYDYNFQNRTDICQGWIVRSLTRDGDAVGAGMELGDTITAVNGKSVTEYTWDEEYIIDEEPKQVLEITGVDGKKKHITLEAKDMWKE